MNTAIPGQGIVRSWCSDMSSSVQSQKLDRHMALVSSKVQVYGYPSKEVINYADWQQRREYEFRHGLLLALNYNDLRIISNTARRVRFEAHEKMLGRDGKMVLLNKHILLEREDDNIWRVVEENINSWRVKKLDLDSF